MTFVKGASVAKSKFHKKLTLKDFFVIFGARLAAWYILGEAEEKSDAESASLFLL